MLYSEQYACIFILQKARNFLQCLVFIKWYSQQALGFISSQKSYASSKERKFLGLNS